MENWLKSVHSDGTKTFLSNLSPKIGETVKIRIRFLEHAPVKHVLLLSFPNGAEIFSEMSVLKPSMALFITKPNLKFPKIAFSISSTL